MRNLKIKWLLKHSSVLLLLLLALQSPLLAQKGNNQIAIGAELGPVAARYHGYKYHVGLPVKGYFGTGKSIQLMIRSGFHHLWVPQAELRQHTSSVTGFLVPIAFGYRRNLGNFYAEGSIGVAYKGRRVEFENPYNVNAWGQYPLNYGFEMGYRLPRFDFGIALQNNMLNHHHDFMHTVMVGLKTLYKIGL